jgi:hypothetical protein
MYIYTYILFNGPLSSINSISLLYWIVYEPHWYCLYHCKGIHILVDIHLSIHRCWCNHVYYNTETCKKYLSQYFLFVYFVTVFSFCILRHGIFFLYTSSQYFLSVYFVTVFSFCILRHSIFSLYTSSQYFLSVYFIESHIFLQRQN